jgi:hypothetical protein
MFTEQMGFAKRICISDTLIDCLNGFAGTPQIHKQFKNAVKESS